MMSWWMKTTSCKLQGYFSFPFSSHHHHPHTQHTYFPSFLPSFPTLTRRRQENWLKIWTAGLMMAAGRGLTPPPPPPPSPLLQLPTRSFVRSFLLLPPASYP
jgi:hypothetical protein